ncbi:hypothetical protein [Hydrogenimonas sp.]
MDVDQKGIGAPIALFHPTHSIIEQIVDAASLDGLNELAAQMDIEREPLDKSRLSYQAASSSAARCYEPFDAVFG